MTSSPGFRTLRCREFRIRKLLRSPRTESGRRKEGGGNQGEGGPSIHVERLDRCGLNFGDATMGNFGTAWWWSRAGWGCRSAGIGGVDASNSRGSGRNFERYRRAGKMEA